MTSWAFPLASCRTMPLIQEVFFKTHNNFTAGPVNDVKLLLIQRVFLKTHDPPLLTNTARSQAQAFNSRGLFQDP